ncbi:MAG: VWA domain-containing protein [Methylococcales bacterium]|nr:VWA domain-containing protein [Methylococcales bacterium]
MNLAEFHFIRPYWLLAIIPYIAIIVLMLRNKLSRGNWSALCDTELLPYLLQDEAVSQSRWQLTTGAIAALLVIIALAGPTWQRVPSPVFRNESALVIALDLSRSMNAEDIKPSRLIRARYKIADILKQRKDGQTALLVYAGDAFTVTPLTDDTQTIDSQLAALTTEIMPGEGSNAESVLEKAVELFRQAGLQKGQILLVTDGVDFNKVLAKVKALDSFTLSVLGVGTADGAPIALPDGGFLKDEQGSIVIPKLNAGDLARLAQAGKGVYQTITANDADIQTLLAAFNQPVKQEGKENRNLLLDQWEDKGPWLLLLALPLAALSFRKGLLCFTLLLLLPLPKNSYAFEWKDLWLTKDQQAQQAYKNEQFEQAAKLFENPDWKAAANYKAGKYGKALENLKNNQTALGAYNQGNALAQSDQLEEAIKAYEKALKLNPQNNDAKYNKELVEKELKKQKQEQQDNKKDNEQQQDKKQDDQQVPKQDSQQGKEGDKSEKSEEQKASEQKPEQSEEKRSQQQQADDQASAENKEQQNKPEEKKPDTDKAQQAEQKKPEKQPKQATAEAQPSDEEQQANEQWLKRIPDDPAGLLRRKFKYQYGQRQRRTDGNAD